MEKKKLKKIIWIYENRIEKHKDINRNKASSVIIVIFLLITILVSLIKDSIFIFLLIPALFFMGFLLPGILFYSFFRVIKNKDKYYNRLIEELDKEGIEIEDEIKLKEFFERYYGIKNFSSWNGEVALLSEKAISYYKKRTAEELSLEEIWDSVERFPDNKDFIFSLENNSGNSSLFIRPQDIEYRKNQKIIQDIDYRRLNRIEEIRAENFNELSVKKKNSMLRILTFISLLIFTFIFRDFFYLLFVFIIFLFLKDIIIKHKEIRNIKKNPELAAQSKFKMPLYPVMNYVILAFFVFVLAILALNEDTRIALLFTPIWFVILWAFYSMLNTDDEDALGEELIEMAGVKEIYKKPKKDDSDDYVI